MKTATAVMNDCYTKYLPSTANSRCSKNVFFCSSDRVTSPDSSPPTVKKLRKGKKKNAPSGHFFANAEIISRS